MPPKRHMKRSSPHILLLCVTVLVCVPLHAQLIQVQGGSSSLMEAQGGSMSFKAQNLEAVVGVGEVGGSIHYGAFVRLPVKSYIFTIGDDPVRMALPTDVFDSNHYLLVRGVGITTRKRKLNIYAFGGASAFGGGAPFFQTAASDRPVGMLFFDLPVTEKLHFYSKNIFSNTQTSISGFEYTIRKDFKFGAAAGLGSNQ